MFASLFHYVGLVVTLVVVVGGLWSFGWLYTLTLDKSRLPVNNKYNFASESSLAWSFLTWPANLARYSSLNVLGRILANVFESKVEVGEEKPTVV